MKFIIAIFIILPISLVVGRLSTGKVPEEFAKAAASIRETCLKKQGLTLDDYEKLKFDGNRTVMCYLTCAFKESGWMDDNNIILYDNVENHTIKPLSEYWKFYLANCPHQPKGEGCEIAYRALLCYKQQVPEEYFWYA